MTLKTMSKCPVPIDTKVNICSRLFTINIDCYIIAEKYGKTNPEIKYEDIINFYEGK